MDKQNKKEPSLEFYHAYRNFWNEHNKEYADISLAKKEIEKTKQDIAKAIIGYGRALKIMNDDLDKQIENLEKRQNNYNEESVEKYFDFNFEETINQYDYNWNVDVAKLKSNPKHGKVYSI